MLPGFVFTAVVVEVHEPSLLQAHGELFALKCAEKVPPNPVLAWTMSSIVQKRGGGGISKPWKPPSCPEDFMEGLLGFYWVLWAFPRQLSGRTDSFSLLPSPKVTSISSACAILPLGLGCVLYLVTLYSLVCVCKT